MKPKHDINLKAFFRLISLSGDVNLFVKGRFHHMSSLFSSFSLPHLKEEPMLLPTPSIIWLQQLHWYKLLKAMSEVKKCQISIWHLLKITQIKTVTYFS